MFFLKKKPLILVPVLVFLITISAIWLDIKFKPNRPFIKGILNYWLAIVSVLSLIIAILILKKIKKPRFTGSRELLDRLINVFNDALRSLGTGQKVKVSILHFAPCPGLFDETFKDDRTFTKYREIISKAIDKKDKIELNICMLNEDDRKIFLECFYNDEKKEVSQQKLKVKGGLDQYLSDAQIFIKKYQEITSNIRNINKYWLDRALAGEEIIVLGAARSVGFVGSVYFYQGEFNLHAADYSGNTNVIHQLFDKLAQIYNEPLNP